MSIPIDRPPLRDTFLFAYYMQGMHFSFVATFHHSYINVQENVIRYRMAKGKKFRNITTYPKLKVIIYKYFNGESYYLFPILKKQISEDEFVAERELTLLTQLLRRVAILCGIDKDITTHISKHTFAYLSLKRGVSYPILKEALGHTDYKTTQGYLDSLPDDDVDDAVKGLYDNDTKEAKLMNLEEL